MDIKHLEKKVEELKKAEILPMEFTLKIIAYENRKVKIAAGNIEDTIFKWNKDGKGYIGSAKSEDIFIDEEGELQLGKSIHFRHYPFLNC